MKATGALKIELRRQVGKAVCVRWVDSELVVFSFSDEFANVTVRTIVPSIILIVALPFGYLLPVMKAVDEEASCVFCHDQPCTCENLKTT